MKILEIFKHKISIPQTKSEEEIIKEIHNEFDTAPQRLLETALSIIASESNSKVILESEIEDKAKRLEKIGFIKNGLVARKKEIDSRNEKHEDVIKMETNQAKLIQYYSNECPFLKFLTIDELDRICEKYGLIYASVKYYKMPVPDKNLKDIEDAQILKTKDKLENDSIYLLTDPNNTIFGLTTDEEKLVREVGIPFNIESAYNSSSNSINQQKIIKGFFKKEIRMRWNWVGSYKITTIDKTGLFIAAPKHHFDLKDLEFDGSKGYFKVNKIVVLKDPIVFRYVKGGVQVITKWGLEADDPAL